MKKENCKIHGENQVYQLCMTSAIDLLQHINPGILPKKSLLEKSLYLQPWKIASATEYIRHCVFFLFGKHIYRLHIYDVYNRAS